MNTKNNRVAYWVELAKYDLDTAQAMLDSERWLYVGFMCHQAIEKILKGYYVSKSGKNPPYTHNLALLAKESGIYDTFSEEHRDFLDLLEPLNIEARYPTNKDLLLKSLTTKICINIINKTRELVLWIENLL